MSGRHGPRPLPDPTAPATAPQLPTALARADSDRTPGTAAAALRAGCYLLRLNRGTPGTGVVAVRYDGTLRVDVGDDSVLASGDLYVHGPLGAPADLVPTDPDPAVGIPVFPRSRYRYYVRVTELHGPSPVADVTLEFELHRFDSASNTWANEGRFSAVLNRAAAPPGYPSPDDFLAGELRDATDEAAGELTMGWISPHLRRAVVEIDRVAESERPVASAAGTDWRAIFAQVGWDLSVVESDSDLAEPSGESWSPAEMHAAMLAKRDAADLDAEWRYWLLCVRSLDGDASRGLMFDRDGADSNNVPREAAAIESNWPIPDDEGWGSVKGMRFGMATDAYFRTAVHEIGHAMGLLHNQTDNGFMNTTEAIARAAVPPQTFPENVLWSYAKRDQLRLRHMPDIWIRPGGVPFGGSHATAPMIAADAIVELDGLRLDVVPLHAAVPIGAPIRITVKLHNETRNALPVPAELSLKAGCVSGSVTDPSGSVRSFKSLIRRTDRRVAELARGETRAGSVTLLRGSEGALFPLPGPYTVDVHVDWELDDVPVRVSAAANVMVLPAYDREHAEAALRILGTPDTVLALAVGGDHLEEGIAAIHAALASDVLRPHYAYVEAKRVATGFHQRPGDIAAAADLIAPDTVMTATEIDKAAKLVHAAAATGDAPPGRLVAVLREKAAGVPGAHAAETLADL